MRTGNSPEAIEYRRRKAEKSGSESPTSGELGSQSPETRETLPGTGSGEESSSPPPSSSKTTQQGLMEIEKLPNHALVELAKSQNVQISADSSREEVIQALKNNEPSITHVRQPEST